MSDGTENLRNVLRVLAGETRGTSAGSAVKSNLLKEMQRRHRKALLMKWWPAMAVAALVMGVWLGLPKAGAPLASKAPLTITEVEPPAPQVSPAAAPVKERPAPTAPVRTTRASRPTPKVNSQMSALTPWYIHPGLPEAKQGHVVFMEVGPETARLFGLTSTGPLQAEVFLGDDGVARAIRLVRTTQIARGE